MTTDDSSQGVRITISQAQNIEIDKIKGSRFVAFAYPFASIGDMEEAVKSLWLKHPEACHICWAYRGSNANMIRAVDDGEPSGTAGRPILNVIEGKRFEGVGVAVVRYFGGTKLGMGGLARAYSTATQAVLAECTEKYLRLCCNLSIEVHYSFEGSLLYLLGQEEALIIDRQYSDKVKITATLLSLRAKRVKDDVCERTSGQAKIMCSEDYWA